MTENDVTDGDVINEVLPSRALSLRRPDVPTTLTELSAHKGEALEILDARVQVVETLRKAAIRLTHPTDWLLFKAPDEQGGAITGYLQDCGCDRVRDLWGIEVFNISALEKVMGAELGSFHYLISGWGRCKLTRQTVEAMEGGRSSTDDFCKGKIGADLELSVRKAARANLDGNIVRELAGMKSVPLAALVEAWEGTKKSEKDCRHGRGFGTRDERVGATREGVPDVLPPVCPHCKSTGVYRPGRDGRGAFYGCPNYKDHPGKKFIVDAAGWVAQQQAAATPAEAKDPPPAGTAA